MGGNDDASAGGSDAQTDGTATNTSAEAPSPALGPIRLSTASLPHENREEIIRDYFGRVLLRLDIEPLWESEIEIDASTVVLPDVSVMRATVSPLVNKRTPDLLADGVDDLVLTVRTSGILVRADKYDPVEVPPGHGCFGSLGHRLQVSGEATHARNVQISRRALASAVPGLDDPAIRLIPPASPALRLLLNYANGLDEAAPQTAELRAAVSTHIIDLVALALNARGDAAQQAKERGLRAARLTSIKADIRENMVHPGFSIASVARRQGVSPRYIHMLFETEGKTFTEYVHEQRLGKAHRMLTSPAFAAARIGDIAHAVGFSEQSTFNRLFRQAYGATPSEVREAASKS